MRPRLFTALPERQRPRREDRSRPLARRRRMLAAEYSAGAAESGADGVPDADVQRVQHAGGPVDVASYSCGCGYLFVAPVSTTVSCPHCGCDQAW